MASVLIIEDEDALRTLYERVLKQFDFDVVVAADGDVAIQYLSETMPDLVLLDIRMPNTSGLDVLLFLQEHPEFGNTHVVIISASQEFQRYAKMLPSAEFLQKPVLSHQLNEIADRIKQKSIE